MHDLGKCSVLQISEIIESDVAGIIVLGERTNEAQVIPQLSSEGRTVMRAARKRDMTLVADKTIYQAVKATIDSELVGYVAWKEGNYITQLYVCPESQGDGVGGKLIDHVKSCIKDSRIHLRASVNAVDFYLKCGFKAQGPEQLKNGIRFVPMEMKL